jgi:hypothetical protein
MIVEDQLDRGAGRIGGIEKLEEFDELGAAVALPDERVDLAGGVIAGSACRAATTPSPVNSLGLAVAAMVGWP